MLGAMWIMVSGPYTAGGADAARRGENLRKMNEAAVAVFLKGHVPLIGVNMALPMIEAAGQRAFDELMMPVSLALAERCDAVVRIGGPSSGADSEVERIRARGGRVFASIDEIEPA
jgi:hypothetical protein